MKGIWRIRNGGSTSCLFQFLVVEAVRLAYEMPLDQDGYSKIIMLKTDKKKDTFKMPRPTIAITMGDAAKQALQEQTEFLHDERTFHPVFGLKY